MVRRWLLIAFVLLLAVAPASSARPLPGADLKEAHSAFESVENGHVVGLADDDATIALHVGDHLVLALGTEYSWIVPMPSPGVLSFVPSVVTLIGCQGEYLARQTGKTQLMAVGTATCLDSQPQGQAPVRQFLVNIVVQ